MLHYEANELELARACHDRGMALSEQVASEYNLAFFQGLGAPIFYAQGETERALAAVQQGYQTAMQTGLVDAEWFLTREAGIRLQEGDLDYARHWAERAGLSVEDEPEYLSVEQHLLYARLLLALSRHSEARRWLARLERFTREHSLFRWLLSVYLLQALAADELGNRELARDRVARALEIAAPHDYVRAVLDESPRLLAYLPKARSVAPEFVDRLAEITEAQAGLVPAEEEIERLVEPLSERELEVLRLIAAGLSNREIAAELVIAVGTVKRHINHIYGKLGVHSRTQALVRARELSLL
jgi:LuxR family maltose regulon positive regulatory protein